MARISPLDTSFCEKALGILYKDLYKIDIQHNLISIGQVMAIRVYKMEIEKMMLQDKPRILFFSTSPKMENMLNGLPKDLVNICAYIDNDVNKKFTMFNRRLVITPDYVKYFKYDKIVILSSKRYKEMYNECISVGVEYDDIRGISYLLELMNNDK